MTNFLIGHVMSGRSMACHILSCNAMPWNVLPCQAMVAILDFAGSQVIKYKAVSPIRSDFPDHGPDTDFLRKLVRVGSRFRLNSLIFVKMTVRTSS